MLTFFAQGRQACVRSDEPITSGSLGLPIHFHFDAAWNGLTKTATITGSGESIDIVLTDTGEAVVPWECLQEAGASLLIGVRGTLSDRIVMPTVLACAGQIVRGSALSGVAPGDPTPSWADQVQQEAREAWEAAGHAPRIVDGYWEVWDIETGAYVSTGTPAEGENGFSPTVAVTTITGGHTVTITDAEGEHSFDVMDGEDGDENVFIATYGVTSARDVYDAVQAGKVCFARDYITVASLIGVGMIGEDRYYAAFAFVLNGEQITYTVTGTTWSEQSAQLAHGTYVHTQSQASAEWTIVHSLRCYPSVTVIDSGGSVCVGEILYLDSNTVRVSFQAAFSGKAYLN